MKLLRFLAVFLTPFLFYTAMGCGGGGGLGGTEGKLTGEWVAEKLNAKGDRIILTFNAGEAAAAATSSPAATTDSTSGDKKTVGISAMQSTGEMVNVDIGTYLIEGGKITFNLTTNPAFESPFTLAEGTKDKAAILTLGTEVYNKTAGAIGGPLLGGQIIVLEGAVDQSVTTGSPETKSAGLVVERVESGYQVGNIESSAALPVESKPAMRPKVDRRRLLRLQSLSAPTDTDYKDQWNLEAMDVTDSWGLAAPVKDVVVAVIDTGIVDHPDLTGRVLKDDGYDFIHDKIDGIPDLDLDSTPGPDPDPTDPGDKNTKLGLPGGSSWHGTHIAGIICAAIDNAAGIAGIATNCKILPIRAMGFEGNGTLSDVAQAIYYAAKLPNVAECTGWTTDDTAGTYLCSGAECKSTSTWTCTIDPARPRADIINMSLGAPMTADDAKVLNDAINAAYAQGVLVVAAAGNEAKGPGWCINNSGNYVRDSTCAFYPAANLNVISVGAVVANLKFASGYSNFGGDSYNSQFIAAPGGTGAQAILSTVNPSVLGGYAELMGTSQAAAHVSGVAAQVWSVIGTAPGYTPVQIRDKVKAALSSSAVDLGTPGRDVYFGYGLVNACGAVVKGMALASLPASTVASVLQLSSTKVNFGPLATTHTAIINGCGATLITVTSATKHVDSGGSGWLDVKIVGTTTPALLNLTVNRAGLSTGTYTATVTVNTPAGNEAITISMTVGTAGAPGGGSSSGGSDSLRDSIENCLSGGACGEKKNTIDLGEVILLLIDAETGDAKWVTRTDLTADYYFQFAGFVPGKYYILAGVDTNNDGKICDAAEAEPCFSYPSLAAPEPFEVGVDTRKADIVLNFAP